MRPCRKNNVLRPAFNRSTEPYSLHFIDVIDHKEYAEVVVNGAIADSGDTVSAGGVNNYMNTTPKSSSRPPVFQKKLERAMNETGYSEHELLSRALDVFLVAEEAAAMAQLNKESEAWQDLYAESLALEDERLAKL